MENATNVFVGAEVVLENGSIINRAGTCQIAQLAKIEKVPFTVFADTHKFLKKNFYAQRDLPQQYRKAKSDEIKGEKHIMIDLTDHTLISHFFTDIGVFTPEGFSDELNGIFKK